VSPRASAKYARATSLAYAERPLSVPVRARARLTESLFCSNLRSEAVSSLAAHWRYSIPRSVEQLSSSGGLCIWGFRALTRLCGDRRGPLSVRDIARTRTPSRSSADKGLSLRSGDPNGDVALSHQGIKPLEHHR
jgi:hypothetical protein